MVLPLMSELQRQSGAEPIRPARSLARRRAGGSARERRGPTSAEIIRKATVSTLAVADELGAKSLALVAFGTGVGGFPLEEAARIEVEEVRRHLDAGSGLERVVFAVRGGEAEAAFRAAAAA